MNINTISPKPPAADYSRFAAMRERIATDSAPQYRGTSDADD